MKNIRIATTTTGSRYVVDRIDFDSDTVHCWGEVVAYRGKRGPNGVVIHSVTHQRSAAAPFVRFPRAEVILVEMVRTEQLCIELLNQAKRAHRRGASGPFAPQTAR